MADATPNPKPSPPGIRTVTGWTILFMVCLRVAIGWHFAYEGIWKLQQDGWRATGYLVASTGPLRPLFQKMVPDVDGLERLTPENLKARIDERFHAVVAHYDLTGDDLEELQAYKEHKKSGDPAKPEDKNNIDAIFADPDFQEQLADYKTLLEEIKAQEALLGTTDYDKERLAHMYARKAQVRSNLLARAQNPVEAINLHTVNRLSEERLARGRIKPEPRPIWSSFIDHSNMWALTLVGICLMLGLFTRLAALGGVGLLTLYYLAMPPWPGTMDGPMAEGHYFIVNKNLIELIALLMIAVSGVGRWAGLDGYISAIRRGGKKAAGPPVIVRPTPAGAGGASLPEPRRA